jgi:hypothetical protein
MKVRNNGRASIHPMFQDANIRKVATSRRVVQCLLAAAVTASAPSALAVPKSVSEPLPLENALLKRTGESEEGKKALAFIMSLTTFRDNEDPSKFYYAPTVRITPNPAGAATVVTNGAAVERRSEIDTISRQLLGLKTEEFMAVRTAVRTLTERLQNDADRLTEAERHAITTVRDQLKRELRELEVRGESKQGELPAYVRDSFLERMADLFGLSGFALPMEDVKNVGRRTQKLGELSQSNGGLFAGNLFAGFTPAELEYVHYYKSLRAELGLPEVRLAVLPVHRLGFSSLAETLVNSRNQATDGVPLFRAFAGSGNLRAATFNFDLTLDGAEKFSSAPPPIIVPVGIKAELTVRPPRFTARLSCDFTTGWSVKGRTDIKDGLIVYNDDIYTDMVAKSIAETTKPCRLSVDGGSGAVWESAYTEALRALQHRLSSIYFHRVSLSKQEKERYWAGVQDDIAAHRHRGSNSGWSGLFAAARHLGFVGTIIGGLSNASRFYWHTNVQNVQSLDQVRFEQEIVIDQNRNIEVDISTGDMCLAWNPRLQRYLACTAEEARSAQSVDTAFDEARRSSVCATDHTTPACADERNERSPVNEHGNIAAVNPPGLPPDVSLPDEI